jgi:hypothetical protein
VFLTSPSGPLGVGVRSGTRRRRGASASAQAAGGIGTETRRTEPVQASRLLYRACASAVQVMYALLLVGWCNYMRLTLVIALLESGSASSGAAIDAAGGTGLVAAALRQCLGRLLGAQRTRELLSR